MLAVIALIAGLYDQREIGPDVFERLARIVDGLPPGEVQKAAREALQRRRSGLAIEQSWQALNRMHPYMKELVFTLRLTGWQASLGFDLALERLMQRAGKQWDRLSRSMVFREQIRPFIQFGLAAILAALIYLVIGDIPAFTIAWPSYAVVGWIGLGCGLAAALLYWAQSRAWLRRFLGTGLLLASLIPAWQYASLPRLFELRLDPVTHLSGSISNERVEWNPVPPIVLGPVSSNTAQETLVENTPPPAPPTPTPTLSATIEVRSQPPSSPPPYQEQHR